MEKKSGAKPISEPEVFLTAEETDLVSEQPVVPPPIPRLAEVDRLALDLAKSQRQIALAEAKTALAQNEKAELAYKYVVLQLYMKYGLSEADAINENGEILKGGALPRMVPNAQ